MRAAVRVSPADSGYANPGYAESLSEFGSPRALPECGGHVLERRIPGTSYRDAMGPYPLFTCRDWSRLDKDLENLKKDLVSLSVVTDPFGDYGEDYLHRCFDVVRPFKEHFVTDLSVPVEETVSKHHRYYSRKASERVRVEECEEPLRFLDEWTKLYANLIERHGLAGIQAFSRESFARQLTVPGITVFRAIVGGETVGMHLWYVSGEVAYSHLAASSERGYEFMSAYALYWFAMEHFAGKVRWLDVGSGAGLTGDTGGLARFKKGWSTGTRPAYFCGRVFDGERYAELAQSYTVRDTSYFPAYRAGEFG